MVLKSGEEERERKGGERLLGSSSRGRIVKIFAAAACPYSYGKFRSSFFLRSFQRKTKKNTISFVVSTISTSESEDIERTYMVTPTFTAGPASSSYKDFSWEGICFDRGGKGSLA